ncbi:hypothetical protein AgCh_014383 [Apium graveolens]
MTPQSNLEYKKTKKIKVEEMIRILERYLGSADTMLPSTQFNLRNDKDDDEQKHDEQKPSGSNSSQSSKATSSKDKKEVRIYYGDWSFTFLGSNLMDTFSPTRIKRVISLLKDKDTATRAWRSVLAEWLIAREERRARNKAEFEEKKRKYDEEIEMYIKRSEELKAKGMSRISKDGRFLNVKAGSFSKFRIEMLDGYPKQDILKLVEALTGTPIIEELEILVYLNDLIREKSKVPVFV